MLTMLWQVVDCEDNRPIKHFRSQGDAEMFLAPNGPFAKDQADLMSDAEYSVRPIWTTRSEAGIKKLLKE